MCQNDLQKAYDMVNREFIIHMLTFPISLVDLIYECTSTPTFSIMINGRLKGYFLQQGTLAGRSFVPLLILHHYGIF